MIVDLIHTAKKNEKNTLKTSDLNGGKKTSRCISDIEWIMC